MKGELITDVNEITRLAKEGKSVWNKRWNRTSPASFLEHWRLKDIAGLVNLKYLFYYEPTKVKIKNQI